MRIHLPCGSRSAPASVKETELQPTPASTRSILTIRLIQGSRALPDLLRVDVSSSYDPPPSGEGRAGSRGDPTLHYEKLVRAGELGGRRSPNRVGRERRSRDGYLARLGSTPHDDRSRAGVRRHNRLAEGGSRHDEDHHIVEVAAVVDAPDPARVWRTGIGKWRHRHQHTD